MGLFTVRARGARAGLAAIIATVAAVGLHAALASAGANFAVNSTGDAVDAQPGNGVCATVAGACTLRAAIQEANALPGADVVDVPPGTYAIAIAPRNQNDITTGDLDITDSLAVNGTGAGSTIVDGGTPPAGASPQVRGLDRLFEVLVDGGTVSFSGLTLSDGTAAEYGGAIANNSTATVSVSSSALTGNVAGKAGGAIDNHLGGALEVRDSTLSANFANESGSAINNNRDGALTVSNSTVSSNSAAAVGLDETLVGAGAIANNADLDLAGRITVSGSQMSGNRAGGGRTGAVISNDGAGEVVVEATTFSKNAAASHGGVIYSHSGQVSVADSSFTENAADDGGAIYNDGGLDGRVTITGSTFSQNTATGRGGAIVSGGTGALVVRDSAFSKNRSDDWGGAIATEDKSSTAIANSTFVENSALTGGGFANEGAGLATVEGSTFTKNAALVTAILASGEGGGLHSNSGGDVVITGGAFTDNSGRNGGGLSNEGGGTLTVTGTIFADNRAEEQGGGILIQSGAVRMVGIDVVDNVADSAFEGGGGISYAGDKQVGVDEAASLEDSRIRDNKAKGEGGGIDSRGDGPLAVTTTSITGNTAAAGGAIHHVGDAPLDVTHSTLSGNFAENGGGVFTDGDGEATVENTTISGNRAGQFGGGFLVSSRLTMRSSTVAGNTAASGGGINNGGGDIVGDGSVFLANTIVAGSPTGGNCAGTITSVGGNVDSADTCRLREQTDQPGTDPRLGPLADNGGLTMTHALLSGSPAQERAVCGEPVLCPLIDQRGVLRPLFFASDAGAYESALPPAGGAPQQCAGRTERPVPADFDTWISQSSATTNFSSDSVLKVETPGKRALVHFGLPSLPPGCKLVDATLKLYSPSATEGRTLEAVRAASPWSNTEVTWNSQPAMTGPVSATASGLGIREWDVLAQTLDMYALGNHGFVIRGAAGDASGEQSFHSTRKAPDSPPELVLIFDDPDAPPQPGDCPTTPQLISADRDSWVSESSPTNNFGNDSTLKVKSQTGANSRALIRFPLPSLPAGCTGVASARLLVEADAVKEGRTLEALQIAGAWTEAGVTWSNQPATSGPAESVPAIAGPLEWSVTDQVLELYASANHGFLIRDSVENGVGDEQTLNSRDKVADSPPQLLLVFDDSTPETAIDSGPPSPADAAEATFSFSADRADATFECSLDGAAFGACSSGHVVRGLTEGDHSLAVRSKRKVRAVDPTPAVYDWSVAIPPETTVAGPESPSASPNPTVTFASDDPRASFECSLNGAGFEPCTSPVEYTDLPDGLVEVRVRAVDSFGNADPTPAVHAWLVAVPPETTITSRPPDPSNSAVARFEFAADEPATFACRLDGGDWGACSESYTDLADGEHTFEVRATDLAGNTDPTPAVYSWTVDTVAPHTMIDAGPRDPTNETSAAFEFGAGEPATFECRLDDGEWTACTSPHRYTDLAEGEHAFQVRATDAAGNQGGAASYSWMIEEPSDTTAPDTTITAQPANPSTSTSATFSFTGSDNETPPAALTFQCRLDGQAFGSCTSPTTHSGLAQGSHTFEVRAVDLAVNADPTPASYTWTVDSTAPQTTIDAGPTGPTNDSTPTFSFFSETGATFQCRVDAAAFASCTSPHTTAAMTDGAHTFEVRATDAAGNTDATPASRAFTVDTTAPQTTITGAPPATTSSTSATFTFTASEAGSAFQCSLDGGAFVACTSPRSYTGLAVGAHQFSVHATDAVGNADATPAGHSWTITAPPQGCSQPATALANADAWIDENSPTSNKGSDSILKVQSKGPRDNFRALVRFTHPAVPQGCAIESATLRLYAPSFKPSRTLQALRLTGAWTENLVSWSNQPQTAGAAAVTVSGQGYREWNVTSHVQTMYTLGANNGFLIRDAVEGQDSEQQFHSREKGANPPQLVLRFAQASG